MVETKTVVQSSLSLSWAAAWEKCNGAALVEWRREHPKQHPWEGLRELAPVDFLSWFAGDVCSHYLIAQQNFALALFQHGGDLAALPVKQSANFLCFIAKLHHRLNLGELGACDVATIQQAFTAWLRGAWVEIEGAYNWCDTDSLKCVEFDIPMHWQACGFTVAEVMETVGQHCTTC